MSNSVIFRGRLGAFLSVNTKNMDFFHGMLLHSSVAMETCFGQLGLYLENCNSYTFKCNSI